MRWRNRRGGNTSKLRLESACRSRDSQLQHTTRTCCGFTQRTPHPAGVGNTDLNIRLLSGSWGWGKGVGSKTYLQTLKKISEGQTPWGILQLRHSPVSDCCVLSEGRVPGDIMIASHRGFHTAHLIREIMVSSQISTFIRSRIHTQRHKHHLY